MAQIKIYGNRSFLDQERARISDTLHTCVVAVLGLPPEKRFHRFIGLESEDFIYPGDRSEKYLILEILLFSGRPKEMKKELIRRIFADFESVLSLHPQDIEITLLESPRENWGIRGMPGDELSLPYSVDGT